MDAFSGAIIRHGAAALFLFSLAENAGLPIPALPVLMLAGALTWGGGAPFFLCLAGAVAGAIAADSLWYWLGRWRGRGILSSLCRVSLNPDACVERAEDGFHRRKIATILSAKFLPGVNTVTPPLAGAVGMPFPRFLLLDLVAAVIWAGTGLLLGRLFGAEIARVAQGMQGAVGWTVVAGIGVYIVWRGWYRRYLVRRYAVPRIDPDDLHRRMSAGEDFLVLDLRSDAAFAGADRMVIGALRVRPATFHREAHRLPRDRELVFYCT